LKLCFTLTLPLSTHLTPFQRNQACQNIRIHSIEPAQHCKNIHYISGSYGPMGAHFPTKNMPHITFTDRDIQSVVVVARLAKEQGQGGAYHTIQGVESDSFSLFSVSNIFGSVLITPSEKRYDAIEVEHRDVSCIHTRRSRCHGR
jgi:hypothetical protein